MAPSIAAVGALCGDAAHCFGGPAGDGTDRLGHADGSRTYHGNDAVPGGFGAHSYLRPDGGAQFRARGFRHGRGLRYGHGAGTAGRLDYRTVADAQSPRLAGGAAGRRRRERRARLCLRTHHHSSGLRRTAAPDPDHHRRPHRHRATGDRDLGTRSHRAAQAHHAARQRISRFFPDRNLSPGRPVRRLGGRRCSCSSF